MIQIFYTQRQRKDGHKYWVQGVIIENGSNDLPFQASVDTLHNVLYFAFADDCSNLQRLRTMKHYDDVVTALAGIAERDRTSELKHQAIVVKQKAVVEVSDKAEVSDEKPKDEKPRHSIRPPRSIGKLRQVQDHHSSDFVREFLLTPAHEPNSWDNIRVRAYERDPSTPLGRYRHIKV